ncbi:MAG: hypothetical protein ACRERR_06930 [Moraxellaceae bacterium]
MSFTQMLLACVALSCMGTAFAGDAYLRLRCEGDSEGADIRINGILKGQCPIDIAVPEGEIALSASRDIAKGQYRLYEKKFFLSAGATKRETVVLGEEIFFTPEGRKRENARLAAAQAAADAEAARQAAAQEAARLQAEADAPRLAAEAEAARLAAIKAQPGAVKRYMAMMSSEVDLPPDRMSSAPFTATSATVYAPLSLPISSTIDVADGKAIVMTDPAAFANPDSMVAQAGAVSLERESGNR